MKHLCKSQATKKPPNDVFGDVVIHDLDLIFEGQIFESKPFGKSKRDYLANGDR